MNTDAAQAEIVRALVIGIPAAIAVIVVVRLFLTRMRESQQLGHEVATKLAQDHKDSLQVVMTGHERALEGMAQRIESAARKHETLATEVRDLCTTLRIKEQAIKVAKDREGT